jgi:hypothetical protein
MHRREAYDTEGMGENMKTSKPSLLAAFCCSLTLGFGLLGCGDDDDDPMKIVDDPCEHPSAICGE